MAFAETSLRDILVLKVVEQEARHEAAVRAFNKRLAAGGSSMQFPLAASPGPGENSRYHRVDIRNFVVVDGEDVHGGYILTHHGALIDGECTDIQLIQLPLSEGIVNPRYNVLGFLLVKDAVSKAPMLYGLGMGGLDMPLPKMLRMLGFTLHPLPFWFRVLNGAACLRNLRPLRATPTRRLALDFVARVPLLPRALGLAHAVKAHRAAPARDVSVEVVPRFGPWADELWAECAGHHSLIAIRDAATLNWRLPPEDKRLHRIQVSRGGRIRGWAVLTDSRFEGHKQFGNMRVSAVVDALCAPEEESAVVGAAVGYARARGVDLIVGNQCKAVWNRALAEHGFFRAASNFVFASSPMLTAAIRRRDPGFERVHMNRCDGDGPIHL